MMKNEQHGASGPACSRDLLPTAALCSACWCSCLLEGEAGTESREGRWQAWCHTYSGQVAELRFEPRLPGSVSLCPLLKVNPAWKSVEGPQHPFGIIRTGRERGSASLQPSHEPNDQGDMEGRQRASHPRQVAGRGIWQDFPE